MASKLISTILIFLILSQCICDIDYNAESLRIHEQNKGKLGVKSRVAVQDKEDLSIAYTPGVAEPCKQIAEDKNNVFKYTIKGHIVAVVSDGTAVLGLGDIGPEAAMPVMEGKSVLFKEFGGVDAFPICLDTKDPEEIIKTVKYISPTFGGINLEDISSPRCFEIEERLKEDLVIFFPTNTIIKNKNLSFVIIFVYFFIFFINHYINILFKALLGTMAASAR